MKRRERAQASLRGWSEAKDDRGITVTCQHHPRQRRVAALFLIVWMPLWTLLVAFQLGLKGPVLWLLAGLGVPPLEAAGGARSFVLLFASVLMTFVLYAWWGWLVNREWIRIERGSVGFGAGPLPMRRARRVKAEEGVKFGVEVIKGGALVVLREAGGRARELGLSYAKEDAERAAARLNGLLGDARR